MIENDLVVERQKLQDHDFSGRRLSRFVSIAAEFRGCSFEQCRLTDASFGAGRVRSKFFECSFDGSRIEFGPGGKARFESCTFRDVSLSDWFCFEVELVDCIFTGTLNRAVFNGFPLQRGTWFSRRRRNEFTGNDFSGIALIDVAFRSGIDLSLQRLPTSPDYLYLPEARKSIETARAVVTKWEDPHRERGVSFLGSLSDELEHGQRQLFFRPADFYNTDDRSVVDSVFAVLAT